MSLARNPLQLGLGAHGQQPEPHRALLYLRWLFTLLALSPLAPVAAKAIPCELLTFDGAKIELKSARATKTYAAVSGPYGKGALPNGTYFASRLRTRPDKVEMSCGGNGAWSVDLLPQFQTDRALLRIHPDHEPPVGTLGCIGIKCEDAAKQLFGDLVTCFSEAGNQVKVVVDIPNHMRIAQLSSKPAKLGSRVLGKLPMSTTPTLILDKIGTDDSKSLADTVERVSNINRKLVAAFKSGQPVAAQNVIRIALEKAVEEEYEPALGKIDLVLARLADATLVDKLLWAQSDMANVATESTRRSLFNAYATQPNLVETRMLKLDLPGKAEMLKDLRVQTSLPKVNFDKEKFGNDLTQKIQEMSKENNKNIGIQKGK